MMERFELEMYGDFVERRYRRMRPEVEAMPWNSFDASSYPEEVLLAARATWTGAAFQEHRTGAACTLALRTLFDARAPLDLVAVATRFPLDELAHVELCARMATLLGGGTEILYDPLDSIPEPSRDQSPLRRAAEAIIGTFCVGEAVSIPLLRGTARAAAHPLPRAVLMRIVRDEAAHGAFGFAFLDWAAPELDSDDRAYLANVAAAAIADVEANWERVRSAPLPSFSAAHALGWMQSDAYLELAHASLQTRVLAPLRERGIDPTLYLASARELRRA